MGDVVVIVLDLAECLLVLLHQLVDMVVLPAARPAGQGRRRASRAGTVLRRRLGLCDDLRTPGRRQAAGGCARAERVPPAGRARRGAAGVGGAAGARPRGRVAPRLALLDLDDFNLPPELEVFPQVLHFSLVLCEQLLHLALVLLAELRDVLVVFLRHARHGRVEPPSPRARRSKAPGSRASSRPA